jgi:hypothetical protein
MSNLNEGRVFRYPQLWGAEIFEVLFPVLVQPRDFLWLMCRPDPVPICRFTAVRAVKPCDGVARSAGWLPGSTGPGWLSFWLVVGCLGWSGGLQACCGGHE